MAKHKPTYCHDYAHCAKRDCEFYEKCYRGFLDREIKYSGFRYATYFMPEKGGKGCEYFMDIKDW